VPLPPPLSPSSPSGSFTGAPVHCADPEEFLEQRNYFTEEIGIGKSAIHTLFCSF